jgi:hypothetical protein
MRLTFLVAVAVKRRVRKLGRFEVDEAEDRGLRRSPSYLTCPSGASLRYLVECNETDLKN